MQLFYGVRRDTSSAILSGNNVKDRLLRSGTIRIPWHRLVHPRGERFVQARINRKWKRACALFFSLRLRVTICTLSPRPFASGSNSGMGKCSSFREKTLRTVPFAFPENTLLARLTTVMHVLPRHAASCIATSLHRCSCRLPMAFFLQKPDSGQILTLIWLPSNGIAVKMDNIRPAQ